MREHAIAPERDNDDLFGKTLETLEATIAGCLWFVVAFFRTLGRLLRFAPRGIPCLSTQCATSGDYVRPLTFMVVSVVAGGFALRALIDARLASGPELDVAVVARNIGQAYGSITIVQMVFEALPITVLALVGTRQLFSFIDVGEESRERLRDVVSYSVGLQFCLTFAASAAAMILGVVPKSVTAASVAAVVGWSFMLYVLMTPAIVMTSFVYGDSRLDTSRRISIVGTTFVICAALFLVGMFLSTVKSALTDGA